MCLPLVPALLIASTAMSAAGSVMSGIQANAQGKFEAGVAKNNEQLAVQARRDAIDRGVTAQVQESRKQAQLQGAQRVALAGAGVDTTFGTAADIAGDTALIGGENRLTIDKNTQREALGYSIQAANYHAQGVAAKAAGSNAMFNGILSAGSTILGGAAQVGKYQAATKAGVPVSAYGY